MGRGVFLHETAGTGHIGKLTIKNRIIMAAMGIRGTCDAGSEEYWGERVRHTTGPAPQAVPA